MIWKLGFCCLFLQIPDCCCFFEGFCTRFLSAPLEVRCHHRMGSCLLLLATHFCVTSFILFFFLLVQLVRNNFTFFTGVTAMIMEIRGPKYADWVTIAHRHSCKLRSPIWRLLEPRPMNWGHVIMSPLNARYGRKCYKYFYWYTCADFFPGFMVSFFNKRVPFFYYHVFLSVFFPHV